MNELISLVLISILLTQVFEIAFGLCLLYITARDGTEIRIHYEESGKNPEPDEQLVRRAQELNRQDDESDEEDESPSSSRYEDLDPQTTLEELTNERR